MQKFVVDLLSKNEHKIDLVIESGDLHDQHEKMHALVVKRVIEFDLAVTAHTPLVKILGNHDACSNQWFLDDNHSLHVYKSIPKVNVIDRPVWIGDGVLACPYVAPGRFKEALNTVPDWEKAKAIFAHQEFRGASFGVIESVHGDEWEPHLPTVYTGHIHVKSWLKDNIYYVGTPYTTGHGEKNDKTIAIIDTETGEVIEIPTNLPSKITIEINAPEFKSLDISSDNNMYRVIITGTMEELETIKRTKKYQQLDKMHKIITRRVIENQSLTRTKKMDFRAIMAERLLKESNAVQSVYQEVISASKTN